MTNSSCFFLIRTKTRSTWGRPWSGTSSRSRSSRWTETFTSTSWNTERGSKNLVKWRSWINMCFSFVQYPFFVAWLSLSAHKGHKAGSNLSVELIIQVAFFIVTLITRATSKVGTRQVTCHENLIKKFFLPSAKTFGNLSTTGIWSQVLIRWRRGTMHA